MQIDIDIKKQCGTLTETQASGLPINDDDTAHRNHKFFTFVVEKNSRKFLSFTLNEKKMRRSSPQASTQT